MTTRKLSSEKIFDTKLYKNLMRRRLPHILVAFLANFFTISVPFMLWMGDMQRRLMSGVYTLERYIERSLDNVRDTLTINLVFMFVLGIYFGIITLGYMMKRRSAHFYHALPQSRETLYTTSVLSALTCVGIGGAATLAIALVQMAAFSLFTPEILGAFFLLLAKNILYFLLTYAITVFAGSFSGNGLVQALMSLVILFYPVATYAGLVLTRMMNAQYFWDSFYFSEQVLQWLSPAFYAGWSYWSPMRVLPTVLCVMITVTLLLGALAVYKRRAIENSERPIVFKTLGTVLKFMFMFTVTMFAGLFFEAIGYSFFHMVFGYVCGAVLSFMLFNTILAKSPKAMFKGVKGLCIFLAAFALFLTVVAFDIFKMDEYVPAADNMSYAEIEVSNAEYDDTRFDDPEMLAALSTLLKNQRDANEEGVIMPLSRSSMGFTVRTVMYTKLGFPIARNYYISKYTEGADEFLKLYANDPRMQEKYTVLTDILDKLLAEDYAVEVYVSGEKYEREIDFEKFYALYKEEYGVADYDRLSKPAVAIVSFGEIRDASGKRNYYSLYDFGEIDYPWTELPIYADMTKTIEYLEIGDRKIEVTRSDSYGDEYAVELSKAALYDTRKPYTDATGVYEYRTYYLSNLDAYPSVELPLEQGEALGDLLIDYERSTSFSRIFTAFDTSCVVYLVYGEPGENSKLNMPEAVEYYDEYGLKYATTEEARVYEEYTFVFPKGMLPAEIEAMLP